MTETTRASECSAAEPTLYLAFELGSTKWTLALATSRAQPPRIRTLAAGDLTGLQREIDLARRRLEVPGAAVRSCYEAGRDGFWLHRWFTAAGVCNVVVDSSSIEVSRRARRAKTDRLDAGSLLQSLIRWTPGERRVWRVVHVPTSSCSGSGAWAKRARRSAARSCSGRGRFATAAKWARCWAWSPCRIAVINGCRTRGSAKPGTGSCDASAFNWRGAGCAISRPARWRRGTRRASAAAAGAVVALGSSPSPAN
jgi:hypothetical protein